MLDFGFLPPRVEWMERKTRNPLSFSRSCDSIELVCANIREGNGR